MPTDQSSLSAPHPTPLRPRVGVIGIGAMGLAMAFNLRGRGYDVWSRDVRAAADAQARAAGIVPCDSPRALAERVEIAIVVVVDAPQIDAVLFGSDGITQADRGARTVMLCSTISPNDTVRVAAALAERGIATIDAPISGGPARARSGAMSMMLAAPADVLAPWRPLLADLADRLFEIGERQGDAAKAKLVNNLLAGINLVAGAEALSLGEKLGLDPHALLDLVGASSGASWMVEDRMRRALADDYSPPRAASRILAKDMTLATHLAASIGHSTPLGDAALACFRETLDRGWAELDDAAVIKTYRRDAGSR